MVERGWRCTCGGWMAVKAQEGTIPRVLETWAQLHGECGGWERIL